MRPPAAIISTLKATTTTAVENNSQTMATKARKQWNKKTATTENCGKMTAARPLLPTRSRNAAPLEHEVRKVQRYIRTRMVVAIAEWLAVPTSIWKPRVRALIRPTSKVMEN